MLPYLYKGTLFGHWIQVPTYGILLAIAFSASYFLTSYLVVQIGEKPRHVDNIFLLVILSGSVGGRLFHVLFENFDYFRANPVKIFAIWEKGAGFTFYGGLLLCLVVVYWYAKKTRINFLNYADSIVPAIGLGVGIGRLACFCAGCCWGRQTHLPWAVTFTNPDSFCLAKNVPLHPVQLYGSFASFVGFAYMLWRFRHRRYPGQLVVHGMALYAGLRFLNEYFRGDDYRGYVFGGLLSYSQLISLFLLPLAVVLWLKLRKGAAIATAK